MLDTASLLVSVERLLTQLDHRRPIPLTTTMPRSIPLLLSAGALLALSAHAKQCVQFDINGNLYAFGGDNDVSLGTSTSWAREWQCGRRGGRY